MHFQPTPVMQPGTRGVVAVSGGLDSMVLLHALLEDFDAEDLVVAHLDHGLHPDSAAHAKRVAEHATTLGIECVVGRDVAMHPP